MSGPADTRDDPPAASGACPAARQSLPQRRSHWLVNFEHGGHPHTRGPGRIQGRPPARIFLNNHQNRAAPGVFAFHVPNGGWRSSTEAAILKGVGVRAGVPDVLAIRQGQTYGLELKAPGGKLSGDQERALADLVAAGALVAVSDSLDDAI